MPASTTAAQPTDRQLSFFNSLAAERGLPTIEHFAEGTTRRQASEAIDGMLALPRVQQAPQPAADGTHMPTPSAETRAGRMLLAGGIQATVTFEDGRHCTVEVRTRGRRGNGWTNMGPGEEGARTSIKILGQRVGWINVDDRGEWFLTLRTRRDEYRHAIHAIFEYAATAECAGGEYVQEASRCGRCFRTLTDPVSIDRGIGPECFGRDTGSQHIAADRDRNGTAVTRDADDDGMTQTERLEHRERRADSADTVGWEPSIARRTRATRGAGRSATRESLSAMADALMTPAPVTVHRADDRGGRGTQLAEAPSDADIRRAREIIAEALDLADMSDGDSRLALRVFDALKR